MYIVMVLYGESGLHNMFKNRKRTKYYVHVTEYISPNFNLPLPPVTGDNTTPYYFVTTNNIDYFTFYIDNPDDIYGYYIRNDVYILAVKALVLFKEWRWSGSSWYYFNSGELNYSGEGYITLRTNFPIKDINKNILGESLKTGNVKYYDYISALDKDFIESDVLYWNGTELK